ncbi:MAG: hypothetical protein K0V04_08535, partial [Deltaproteobacteria bacterium]|nr:hypothetical protein [Deltaproteobacteria bacterium]
MGDDAAVVDPLSTDRGALRRELEREVVAMGLCAAGAGQALPPDLLPILQTLDEATGQPSVEQLVAAHAALSELVQPAKPRSLAVLHRYGALDVRRRSFRGLPITRSLMVGAVVCLVAISALGMSPLVSADPAVSNPMLSSGLPLLVNLGFIMAIAMLGALFHELFIVSGHLTQGTYDPRYNTSYWARIVLGVISGVLLSWLIAIPSTSTMHGVGRPAMALVGGFSAGLVHRILERMVSAVESMFSSQLADLQGKQRAVDGQAERQATQPTRLEAASMLMDLQHGIGDGADPSEVRAKLRDAAQAMVSGRPSTPSTPSATVTPDPRGGEATGTRSMPSRLAASMPSNDESSSASVAGPASAADPGPVVARESMGESAPAADSRASNAVAASATPQPTAASAPAFASTAAVGP